VENETLTANRKLLGAPLLLWFHKVLKAFKRCQFEGPVWADDTFHLRFLAQLHELHNQEQHWLSIDQRLEICGVAAPVTDESLRRAASLPQSHQLGLSGFGSVGLQGQSINVIPVQPPRPNVPSGVGGVGVSHCRFIHQRQFAQMAEAFQSYVGGETAPGTSSMSCAGGVSGGQGKCLLGLRFLQACLCRT